MFRGKESSNRIKISQLVEFWCFGLPAALGRGQVCGGVWGMGGITTHVYMHTHPCTCTHGHVYIYTNCKWPPHGGIHVYHVYNIHVCMCIHVCMGHHPHTHTHPYPNTPTRHLQGGYPRISKKSITLELIKII